MWAPSTGAGSIVRLSVAVDPTLSAALAGGADVAASNAVSSWNMVTEDLSYVDADYLPVENSRTNFMTMWTNEGKWEGGVDEFGMGANIDIFARDQDFMITDYRGKVHGFKDSGQSGAGSLAFTLINASNNQLLSVDVYLNSDYPWSTTGANFDVETVLLHELGHAVGLDHPDQAVAMGSVNYDPWTYEPGAVSTGLEPMHSGYWPDGICRELTADEIGGLTYLYPGPDVYVNLEDFVILKQNFGQIAADGDFDFDGDVDLDDFVILKRSFAAIEEALPEPATLGLLVTGGLALLRRRR